VLVRQALHLEDPVPYRRVDRGLVACGPVEPRADADPRGFVEVASLEGCLFLLPRRDERRVVLPPVDPLADQDELPDELRAGDREVERDVPAHRDADDSCRRRSGGPLPASS